MSRMSIFLNHPSWRPRYSPISAFEYPVSTTMRMIAGTCGDHWTARVLGVDPGPSTSASSHQWAGAQAISQRGPFLYPSSLTNSLISQIPASRGDPSSIFRNPFSTANLSRGDSALVRSLIGGLWPGSLRRAVT